MRLHTVSNTHQWYPLHMPCKFLPVSDNKRKRRKTLNHNSRIKKRTPNRILNSDVMVRCLFKLTNGLVNTSELKQSMTCLLNRSIRYTSMYSFKLCQCRVRQSHKRFYYRNDNSLQTFKYHIKDNIVTTFSRSS